jgi:hypothetical protein
MDAIISNPTIKRKRAKGMHERRLNEYLIETLYLPTLTATDARGRTYTYDHGNKHKPRPSFTGVLRLPTMTENEYRGSSKAKFRGSKSFRGAKMSEGLRTCETDPIYLNPSFGELVMGFPIGWTELLPSETQLCHNAPNGWEKES